MKEGGWVRLANASPAHRGYVLSLDSRYAHILWDGGRVDIHDISDLRDDIGPRTVHASLYDSLEYGTMEDDSRMGMYEARREAVSEILPLLIERLARDATVRASLARVEDEDSKSMILRGIANRALQEYLEEEEE